MQRALRVERRGECVGCRMERGAEGVAAGLEHVALLIADAMAQQRIVARECRAHRRSVSFPQARAALDVGEHQRNGAGGEVCHRVVAAGRGGLRE